MDMSTMFMLAAVASLIVQFLKNHFATTKYGTQAIVLVLAFVCAIGWQVIMHYGMWDVFVKVLTSMTMIYVFLGQHIEDAMK